MITLAKAAYECDTSENWKDPEGFYDPVRQQFVTAEGIPAVFGITGSPTTYSTTTSSGKDNDMDDKGT